MESKKSKTIVKEHRYLPSDEDECDPLIGEWWWYFLLAVSFEGAYEMRAFISELSGGW